MSDTKQDTAPAQGGKKKLILLILLALVLAAREAEPPGGFWAEGNLTKRPRPRKPRLHVVPPVRSSHSSLSS